MGYRIDHFLRAQNEYDFGLHTPDVKSLFNTFNFVFDKNGKLITRGGAFTMKHGGLINTIINYGRKDNKRTRSI
jgi:flagellar basal body rod protein FlgG